MNFSQRLGLFILIVISLAYVYFSFFNKDFKLPEFNRGEEVETPTFNPLEQPTETKVQENEEETTKPITKNVKIFILDKSGNLRSVNRTCDSSVQKSCFEFAMNELINAPSKWEKSKGFTSEIPQGTKILSIRDSEGSMLLDLSSNFEAGGGAESTYMRVKQVIKTVNANTALPAYLYINGHQANVIGGEGIMIKQPLNERSLDE